MDRNSTSNRTSSFNDTIYFIEPQTNPELQNCHGFELKSELEVNMWKFHDFSITQIFREINFSNFGGP